MVRIFKENSTWRALLASITLNSIGFGLYRGVIDNYLAESVQMGEFGKGVTEFFRELPGVMLIVILAVLFRSTAARIYKIGGLLMLAGMAMQASIAPSKVLVTLAILIYSTGEHIQLGMKNTLTLEYAAEGKSGHALGWQSAVYQIGNLAGFMVVSAACFWFAMQDKFTTFFWIATAAIGLGYVIALPMISEKRTASPSIKDRLYFSRKFTKYYWLEIFYGARKQVFFTFGPYVLVLFYGANAGQIGLLFAISSIACFVMSPLVGKLVDKIGYKPVMIGDTLLLVVVCFFYGFAHHIFPMKTAFYVCCVNYVLDSVISLAAMASNVYVQDLSDNNEEMRATISTGISVNHLITIFIALFGGLVWMKLGIETLFVLSAVLGLCNSAFAATIKVPGKLAAAAKNNDAA